MTTGAPRTGTHGGESRPARDASIGPGRAPHPALARRERGPDTTRPTLWTPESDGRPAKPGPVGPDRTASAGRPPGRSGPGAAEAG